MEVGASYEYLLMKPEWNKNNVAIEGKLGFEESYRFISLCAVGYYAFGSKNWSAGGELNINPLGLFYAYDTPININIIAGGGYKSFVESNWYGRVGLQLIGRMGNMVTPYIRCTCDFNSGVDNIGLDMSVGLRFWFGKDW